MPDIDVLYKEVAKYLAETDVSTDGERLYSNYERATAILLRLQEIRNDLSYLEVTGRATPELKKFRTMILDTTIDRFQEVARYESRKITARAIEMQLEK